jgi:hypothetical protein
MAFLRQQQKSKETGMRDVRFIPYLSIIYTISKR